MAKRHAQNFEQRLDEALSRLNNTAVDDFTRVLKKLKDIASALQRRLTKGIAPNQIVVSIAPGFQVNIGQQMNCTIRVPTKNFTDILFRAYVPAQGYPVGLDLVGEELLPCGTEVELENNIIQFLARPEITERLRQWIELSN